jgi:hypothetical protein
VLPLFERRTKAVGERMRRRDELAMRLRCHDSKPNFTLRRKLNEESSATMAGRAGDLAELEAEPGGLRRNQK